MCGRCASSRDAQGVRHACSYRPRDSGKKAVKPTWYDSGSQTYYPSYNICPQTNTPVLVSGHHRHILDFRKAAAADCEETLSSPADDGAEERVLQVMQWGLIPSWHRGDNPSSFGSILNNCRRETMFEKPSFRSAIERGRRCVVVADGFFEWYRDKGQRQPYFIYFTDHAPSEEMMEISSVEAAGDGEGEGREGEKKEVKLEKNEVKMEVKVEGGQESHWEHPTGRMLTMAGLFDIWRNPKAGESPLYTYTIVTVEASPSFAKIHHRMPAVLDGQEAVGAWLDPTHSAREVADLLHPVDCLSWHPVSSVVNNSRNHTSKCVVPYDISKEPSSGQKTTLMKWFTPQSSSSSSSSSAPPSTKKPRFQ